MPATSPSTPRSVAQGATVGLGYGVALRAWMRLISEDPEFTWIGTLTILGAFTVLGSMAGLVVALFRAGRTRTTFAARVVGIVLSMGCFLAAGILMLPTIVPASLGWGRVDWWRWVRAALVAAGAIMAVVVVMAETSEIEAWRRWTGLVGYLLLCPVEVALVSRLYAPSLPRGTVLRWRREPAVTAVPA